MVPLVLAIPLLLFLASGACVALRSYGNAVAFFGLGLTALVAIMKLT